MHYWIDLLPLAEETVRLVICVVNLLGALADRKARRQSPQQHHQQG
jgi:hypothetical protein